MAENIEASLHNFERNRGFSDNELIEFSIDKVNNPEALDLFSIMEEIKNDILTELGFHPSNSEILHAGIEIERLLNIWNKHSLIIPQREKKLENYLRMKLKICLLILIRNMEGISSPCLIGNDADSSEQRTLFFDNDIEQNTFKPNDVARKFCRHDLYLHEFLSTSNIQELFNNLEKVAPALAKKLRRSEKPFDYMQYLIAYYKASDIEEPITNFQDMIEGAVGLMMYMNEESEEIVSIHVQRAKNQ